jgi:hypothetical protein
MIKKAGAILQLIVGGGVEMCWVYAWASFSMNAIMNRPYSFRGAVSVFLFAAILTGISTGRGWRIVQVGALHALGFGCTALTVLHGACYSGYQILDTAWITELFGSAHKPLEWVDLTLLTIWSLLFWISGVRLVKRPKAYFTACSRFDIGLAAFFCLFLTKLVILAKGGIRIDDSSPLLLVYPFFILSLLSIGMAKIERRFSKTFLPGYHGIGIMASFVAAVILTVGTSMLFFLPALTVAAEAGYGVVKGGSSLLFPLIVGVARFMFMGHKPRPEPTGASPKEHAFDSFGTSGNWWTDLFEKVMVWGIQGFVILALLFAGGFVAFRVIKWLFSRTALTEPEGNRSGHEVRWWSRLLAVLILFYRRTLQRIGGYGRAAEIYEALLIWARHSGIYVRVSETPLELANRISRFFPHLGPEFSLIVSAFHEEVYADMGTPGSQLASARSALRRLRSPLHWPRRIRMRFLPVRELMQE